MQVGTKVYWFEEDWAQRMAYRYGGGKEKPEIHKRSGVVMTLPCHDSGWDCLVSRDDTGRIVKVNARKLYVKPPELPL